MSIGVLSFQAKNNADVTKFKLGRDAGIWKLGEVQNLYVTAVGAKLAGTGVVFSKETDQETGEIKWKNKWSVFGINYESESSSWWGNNYRANIVFSGTFGGAIGTGVKLKGSAGFKIF